MILILVGLKSFGQKFPPVRDYNEAGYSVLELKSFSLGSTTYQNNFYQAMLDVINDGLRLSGKHKKLKEFP